MGMDGGAACYTRVCMMPSPRLPRVRHTHAAVFSHSSEVRPLRPTRTQCKVKRQCSEQTEPSLARNLFVTLPLPLGVTGICSGWPNTLGLRMCWRIVPARMSETIP
jgi:hypothetical protein